MIFYWCRHLPAFKKKAEKIPLQTIDIHLSLSAKSASVIAEIILIKTEEGSFLNLSEYWNIIKYGATVDTPQVDVHVACVGKENIYFRFITTFFKPQIFRMVEQQGRCFQNICALYIFALTICV